MIHVTRRPCPSSGSGNDDGPRRKYRRGPSGGRGGSEPPGGYSVPLRSMLKGRVKGVKDDERLDTGSTAPS